MHTYEEYRQILTLWESGFKKKRISVMTGITRAVVRDCIARYESVSTLETIEHIVVHKDGPEQLRLLKAGTSTLSIDLFKEYIYLLGLYLGDGNISKEPRTYKLRIVLDLGYPNIIVSCMDAIRVVTPRNKVNTVKKLGNCVEVFSYSNFWPNFFPQHGPGQKHNRQIVLEGWQDRVANQFPLEFLKGLYHSDGSRPHNVVNGKDYPRYEFNNKSNDIRALFSQTCDRLGLNWTTATNGLCIQIARRDDVEFLDRHIGQKT